MKKLLFILSVLVCTSVFAQDYNQDQKYSFWSNWTVGCHFSAADQLTPSDGLFNPGIGFGVDLSKQLNNHWDLRLIGEAPVILKPTNSGFNRIGAAMVGLDYRFIKNGNFYALIDAGISTKVTNDFYGYFTTDAGLGYNITIGSHNIIKLEAVAMCIHPTSTTNMELNGILRLGWAYRFGMTNLDKTIAKERELILLEYNDMKSDYTNIKNAYTDTCAKISKLYNIIAAQDDTIKILRDSIVYLNNEIDILWDKIDEAVTYTSAPAVVFECNSYEISKDQNKYVDYIAEYCKNSNCNILIYGYADSQTGSLDYNNALSQKRADALKKALIKRHVDGEKINAVGKGINVCFGDSNSAASRKAIVILVEE